MLTIGKAAQVTLALALPTSIILIYYWYKNRSDEETYGKHVVTSRSTTIEVKVPQRAIGVIIGRHGENIKRIQKETGARMHFQNQENGQAGGDSDSKTTRTLIILGTPESAQQAELMIHQVIAELPIILTEEIELPGYAIGRIIGKGGVTIREMSSISGAKIFIDRSEDFKNSGRPRKVVLSGSRQQIDCALVLIQDKLEEEEVLRAQLAVTEANRNHRSKKQTTQPIKITPVPKKEETWDSPSTGCLSYQESLLNNVYIEVYVSAVEHPGHFWVQKIGTKALQLEQLQNDITQFACSDDAKLNFSIKEVNPGELVAARYEINDMTYYRAKIIGETPDGKVDLYFVDYGDNAYADKETIFKLRSDFVDFPYQAIECMLANVEPVGEKWSEESISYFEDLTFCAKWKSIQICVMSYKTVKGDVKWPVVQLFNTRGPEDINVGVELVNKGYAVLCDFAKQADRI